MAEHPEPPDAAPPADMRGAEAAGDAPTEVVGTAALQAPAREGRRLERSRVGTIWTALAIALVVLLLLLVFILQNQQDVEVSYLWMSGRLPLGVALLLAAVGGALLVVLVGVARIVQLRLVARRRGRHGVGQSPPPR